MDSTNKKHIRIPDLLKKSRQKALRSQQKNKRSKESIDVQYGTDSKKCSKNNSYHTQLQQMKTVMQSCNSCLQKISQFKTKKPDKLHRMNAMGIQQKSTQTTNKPFLINLIEQRVTQLCHQNRKLTKILMEKDVELHDRQTQISQIQDKFTNILYTLGQQLSELKLSKLDIQQIQLNSEVTSETPAYIKALMLDSSI